MALSAEQFVGLMAAHQRELYRYILVMMPSATDADDIFQEAVMAMYVDRERFDPDTNFVAWATAIARHRVLAARKKHSRDRLIFSADLIERLSEERATMGEELDDLRSALDRCLPRLTDPQRELVQQRYSSEESIQQVAQRTGRPVKTLYKALERVRGLLMQCIERQLKRHGA